MKTIYRFLLFAIGGLLIQFNANASNIQDYSIHAAAINYPGTLKLLDLQSTGVDVTRSIDSDTNFVIKGAGWFSAWFTSGDVTAKYGADNKNNCTIKFHFAYIFQWKPDISGSCNGNLQYLSNNYDGSYDYTLNFGSAHA